LIRVDALQIEDGRLGIATSLKQIPGNHLSYLLSLLTQQALANRCIVHAQANDERTFSDSADYLLRKLPALLFAIAGKSFVSDGLQRNRVRTTPRCVQGELSGRFAHSPHFNAQGAGGGRLPNKGAI
jgi:hypothetical protein